MTFARLAGSVWAAFGLTVTLTGQSSPRPAPVIAAELQHVMGRVEVEATADGRTRIQFWLNTPTYLAKLVVLEADKFSISRGPNSSQLIESTGVVRLTGFALTPAVLNNAQMLQNAEGSILTWDRGFRFEIPADGTPLWFCCPRQD